VKWEEYASRHGVDVKRDIWRDRARMTINWLRPFMGLTLSDYKIFARNVLQRWMGYGGSKQCSLMLWLAR
jgi:hypothetical protein